MIIMTDSMRNKVVGVFNSTTEALKYAKEEDIKGRQLRDLQRR